MNIDISRVNLLEKDIEEWLYENPGALGAGASRDNPIASWVGRQYQLPSGIADLIAVREDGMLVVIEVKNVPINKAAVLQVCRYQDDLKHIVSERMGYPYLGIGNEPIIEMILVGPSIDGQTFTEAQAVRIRVLQFSVSLSVHVSALSWQDEHRSEVREQQSKIAAKPEWDMYGITIAEDIERRYGKGYVGSKEHFEDIAKYAHEYAATHEANDHPDGYSDIAIDDFEESEDR